MRRIAFALAAFVVAGCGGAKAPSVVSVPTPTTTSAARSAAAGNTNDGPAGGDPALAYARCMRSSGVHDFPDPSPSGGFTIHTGSGVNPSSPAFKSAQSKCRQLMLGSDLAPGTTTHPTSQWLAQMVTAAQCMRRHGIPNFPDPTTTVPPMPIDGRGVISDIDGVIFTFGDTIDTQSTAFVRAATACGFPLHNH